MDLLTALHNNCHSILEEIGNCDIIQNQVDNIYSLLRTMMRLSTRIESTKTDVVRCEKGEKWIKDY